MSAQLNANKKEPLNGTSTNEQFSIVTYGIKVHYQSAVGNDHSRRDRNINVNFSKRESFSHFIATHERQEKK